MIRTSYKFLIVLAIMFLILGLAACSTDQTATPTPTPTPTSTPDPTPAPVPTKTPAWMEIELTDVTTGKNFKISDFKGKTILMESFAVWCPTCLAQQKQMQKLGQGEDENIIHISLDTDPNEDEERVFWDKIDLGDYLDKSNFVKASFPNLKPTTRLYSTGVVP